MSNLIILIVLIGLVIAAIKDMKTGKISNGYNLGFGLVGIACSLVTSGVKGLLTSLAGAVIPVVLLMVLFSKGVLGAGDIKLFSALGTFAGLEVIWLLVYSFLLCGLYGLVLMLVRFIGWLKVGRSKGTMICALTRGRHYTKVAFSVFMVGGYIWYLMKGGILLGI